MEAFDYRGKSLLDLASEAVTHQHQVAFLDEHFRSTPRIIGFSNRQFYRGALRVMTRRPETEETRSLFLRRVAGCRRAEGYNPEEAAALVEDLASRVAEEAQLPRAVCHSLGVLSPFREQVEHLRQEIQRRLRITALERHCLLVGTPYAFQGEERDVMLLSLALDPSSPAGAFRYLERPDVFNVAVTRARDAQLLFCSLDPDDAPPGSLLHRYLTYAAEGPEPSFPEVRPHRDRFLLEVQEALEAQGFRTWPAYMVAGFPIDLVVARDGGSLGIDLVGHPGAFADAFDLERCRMLQRAGLKLFPLSFFSWRRDPSACLAAIAARIGSRASSR